jgi:hypothetical protein
MANLSFYELKAMGYKLSSKLWATCRNTNERSVGGRPRLDEKNLEVLNEILEKNSSISSNKTVKVRKRRADVLNESKSEPASRAKINKKETDDDDQSETEVVVENVRFRKISVKEIKSEYERKQLELNNGEMKKSSKMSLTSIHKYLKKAKLYKKSQNVS